jgi:hypothetical protein
MGYQGEVEGRRESTSLGNARFERTFEANEGEVMKVEGRRRWEELVLDQKSFDWPHGPPILTDLASPRNPFAGWRHHHHDRPSGYIGYPRERTLKHIQYFYYIPREETYP